MTTLRGYKLNDAVILRVLVESGEARVTLRDWREQELVLAFEEFAGLEGTHFLNEDLSHGEESTSDDCISRCQAEGAKDDANMTCFRFVSAWSDQPILKIVASGFRVVEPKSPT